MAISTHANQVPEQVQALQKEFDEFIYMASHDLKEPARKIVTFGDRLTSSLGEKLSENEKEYFTRMMDAARRQQSMIDDLLKLSRIKTTDFKKEKINLKELVADLVVSPQTDFKFDVPEIVYADKRQLAYALQELIRNAEKFSGEKPVLKLKSKSIFSTVIGQKGLNSSRSYAYIILTDNGVGIPPENLEDVFRPFFRIHGRGEFSGSGMGLAIVKAIIDKIGGAIWAEQSSKGASFHVLLPST
ncbi:sensor histidine kinase [Jiulongibacter sp. NS-SX5]|uniref:sensor histidine kinase n=1 Tax=Jiulongibacter sp. NS-SX5 TaxID=3463854 RepID=UPI004058BB2E